MKRVPVYILAGGKSSRFGSDKARATVDGSTLIRRIARSLSPIAAGVTAVADRKHKYADLGLRTIADARPGLGPLGGLATALADFSERDEDWLLLTSCDALDAKPAWARQLMKHAAPPARAVAFRADRWEPLFGLYHASAAAVVNERLETDSRSMWRFLEALGAVAMPRPDDWPAIAQANTPEELERYRRSR